LGNVGEILDEDSAPRSQALDNVAVMHDLVAHVDRRPMPLEHQLDDLDGVRNTSAKPPRIGNEYPLAALGHRVGHAATLPRAECGNKTSEGRGAWGEGRGADKRISESA